jgi:membrane-associated PAP2 superfamily phosphatase
MQRQNMESLSKDLNYRNMIVGFIVFFILAAIMTIIFIVSPFDILIQMQVFDPNQPEGSRFIYSNLEPWKFLYLQEGAILLTYLLISLLMFLESRKNENSAVLALFGWFILLTAIIGTGFVVNGIFKGYWGRPRPRDTFPFGNEYPFYHVWYPAFWDIISTTQTPERIKDILDNSSFSAGHPSEAIVFIAIFLILSNPEIILNTIQNSEKSRKLTLISAIIFSISSLVSIFLILDNYNKNTARILGASIGFALVLWCIYKLLNAKDIESKTKILKSAKYMALSISIIGGVMMGVARAVQFGHWPSDSMWTFIFVYIIAFGLYFYVFQFQKSNYRNREEVKTAAKPIIRRLMILLYPFVIIASIIWILEFMLLPNQFLPELIAGILLLISLPVLIKKLN